jgi:alkylation response protein AidB-like acyl-CoA dehydrogenase
MAAIALGLAQGAFNLALSHARSRRQFGRAIGDFQMIGAKLADMYTEIGACRAWTYEIAERIENGDTTLNKQAAAVKLMSSEIVMRVTMNAVQIHGGYGYMQDLPVERMMRDAKVFEIGAGTSEIQRHIISKALLKGNTT